LSSIFRTLAAAAAGVVAAAALVVTATPASASSGLCPYEASTRLLTADDRNYRVWVVAEDAYGRTRVCFRFGPDVAGSLIISDAYLGHAPNVTVERDFGVYCPDIFDIEDPVVVLLEAGLFVGRTLCIGVAGEAYAINVTFPSYDMPRVVLSLDRGSALARTYCDVFPETYACEVDYAEVPIL
jgi:hypothetical protein